MERKKVWPSQGFLEFFWGKESPAVAGLDGDGGTSDPSIQEFLCEERKCRRRFLDGTILRSSNVYHNSNSGKGDLCTNLDSGFGMPFRFFCTAPRMPRHRSARSSRGTSGTGDGMKCCFKFRAIPNRKKCGLGEYGFAHAVSQDHLPKDLDHPGDESWVPPPSE